jgi:hypothetical protein
LAIFDDNVLRADPGNVEIVNPVGRRKLKYVFHDIDGTHSLIRDWPPVMSISVYYAMHCGLADDFDSPAHLAELIEQTGKRKLEETDRFCVESAGLSALTQMEFGIRRAIELGNLPDDPRLKLTDAQRAANSEIIRRIWNGQERFDDIAEPPGLLEFIHKRTPRLFMLYEAVLNGANRDRNTADARKNPARWRVKGSMEFMKHLAGIGLKNFFVTGAVIYANGGMGEEVEALGYEVGPGKLVEALEGSSWDKKLPKDEVMRELCQRLSADPAEAMVIGDGRTEVRAGAIMGSVTLSRLSLDAHRARQLHVEAGTNYILPDFTHPSLTRMLTKE